MQAPVRLAEFANLAKERRALQFVSSTAQQCRWECSRCQISWSQSWWILASMPCVHLHMLPPKTFHISQSWEFVSNHKNRSLQNTLVSPQYTGCWTWVTWFIKDVDCKIRNTETVRTSWKSSHPECPHTIRIIKATPHDFYCRTYVYTERKAFSTFGPLPPSAYFPVSTTASLKYISGLKSCGKVRMASARCELIRSHVCRYRPCELGYMRLNRIYNNLNHLGRNGIAKFTHGSVGEDFTAAIVPQLRQQWTLLQLHRST